MRFWLHSGEKAGTYLIRFADGCFVPKERVVDVPDDTPADKVFGLIEADYKARGVPLEYQPNQAKDQLI